MESILSALHTLVALGCFLSIIGSVLVAFHYFDKWQDDRRDRHFGGV